MNSVYDLFVHNTWKGEKLRDNYKVDGELDQTDFQSLLNDNNLRLEIFIPKITELFGKYEQFDIKKALSRLGFILSSGGAVEIYYIISNLSNEIVHTSIVIKKCAKFQFMQEENSIEIGPCFTNAKYRGKGIYPLVLKEIMYKYREYAVYIFANHSNQSSIRGILKAGFTSDGIIEKNCFKIYKRK